MKITGNEVLAHYEALGSVAQLKMGGRLAIIILSNIKALEPHFKAVVETMQKIHKENKGDSDKIKSELEELGEQEIEVSEYTKVDISAFDSCEAIEPAKIIALSFMIKD
jgi:hypothetical protein|nr:MAG TPA: hypothetical protein [Caudoviricetes sp.]